MNRAWNELNEADKAAIADDFIAARTADALIARSRSASGVSHRRLYAYARNAATDVDGSVRAAIDAGDQAAQDWLSILEALGAEPTRTRAAASTGAAPPGGETQDGRWRYELNCATTEPFECCLIIDVARNQPAPQRLHVSTPQAGNADVVLDPPHRGVIQMLFAADDPLVAMLNDPDRQVRMW